MDTRRIDSDRYRRLTLVKNLKIIKKRNRFPCVEFKTKTKTPREQPAHE